MEVRFIVPCQFICFIIKNHISPTAMIYGIFDAIRYYQFSDTICGFAFMMGLLCGALSAYIM